MWDYLWIAWPTLVVLAWVLAWIIERRMDR